MSQAIDMVAKACGVRPSSGAATSARLTALKDSTAASSFHLSAPEDRRTPLTRYALAQPSRNQMAERELRPTVARSSCCASQKKSSQENNIFTDTGRAEAASAQFISRRESWARDQRFLWLILSVLTIFWLGNSHALAQATNNPPGYSLNLGVNFPSDPRDVDIAIRIVFALTLLTLAPSLIMLMTCFTRIVIVFSFLRSALSLQGAPATQLLIGFSLFLTFFIMAPTFQKIEADALQPYSAKQINSQEAFRRASEHMRQFMLRQTRAKDVEVFVSLAKLGPITPEQLPLRVVIPGFILSELRTGFQMGFLLFIPFILIDFVVAIVLMSLGLMMLPPAFISLPLKILLFVLVDGWSLLVRSLAMSFAS